MRGRGLLMRRQVSRNRPVSQDSRSISASVVSGTYTVAPRLQPSMPCMCASRDGLPPVKFGVAPVSAARLIDPTGRALWEKAFTFAKLIMCRPLSGYRILVALVSIAAWFVASNHCAMATSSKASPPRMDSGCPMHAQHQDAPHPEKGGGCGDLPCCKNLPATVAIGKTIPKPISVGDFNWLSSQLVRLIEVEHPRLSPLLDTGPPGENNFIQLVLHRSIRVHAPPSLI